MSNLFKMIFIASATIGLVNAGCVLWVQAVNRENTKATDLWFRMAMKTNTAGCPHFVAHKHCLDPLLWDGYQIFRVCLLGPFLDRLLRSLEGNQRREDPLPDDRVNPRLRTHNQRSEVMERQLAGNCDGWWENWEGRIEQVHAFFRRLMLLLALIFFVTWSSLPYRESCWFCYTSPPPWDRAVASSRWLIISIYVYIVIVSLNLLTAVGLVKDDVFVVGLAVYVLFRLLHRYSFRTSSPLLNCESTISQ